MTPIIQKIEKLKGNEEPDSHASSHRLQMTKQRIPAVLLANLVIDDSKNDITLSHKTGEKQSCLRPADLPFVKQWRYQ